MNSNCFMPVILVFIYYIQDEGKHRTQLDVFALFVLHRHYLV